MILMLKQSLLLIVMVAAMVPLSLGQIFHPWSDLEVSQSGTVLFSPFAGGLNEPQFSMLDLNGDQVLDLVAFDRSGDRILPFLQDSNSGSGYRYVPALISSFPPLRHWVLFRDYDCDGKHDLFTSHPDSTGVQVFRNTSQNGTLSFELMADLLQTTDKNVFVPVSDIPAIEDIDGDGDVDILSFDAGGLHVQWYENISNCNGLDFIIGDNCWGNFMEAGLTNDVLLDVACKREEGNHPAHAGSTISAFDQDGDGVMDIMLGDLNNTNLVYLHNAGTASAANIDAVQMNYPSNSVAVNMRQFPGSFFVDVSGDGLDDLIVSPNISGISLNVDNVWYYENAGTSNNYQFSFQQKDFLQEEMIDLGRAAKPVFFDYNGDGLMDIVAGNYLYRDEPQTETSSLWVFRNSGTATMPVFERLTTDYLNLKTLFNPARFSLHPAFGDLDGDGDDDLIIGDENGNIHYFKNIASAGNAPNFILFAPEYAGIDIGADAAPQLIDLNRDGLMDLLIGERSGNLNYFENQGSIGNPSFASSGVSDFGGVDVLVDCCTGYSVPYVFENEQGEYEMLVGTEFGDIHHYTQIDNNLSGIFTLETLHYGQTNEGSRISLHGSDITADGKKEWIIGNSRGGFSIFNEMPSTAISSPQIDLALRIWPNPGSDLVQLEIPTPQIQVEKVDVRDMQGRLLFSTEFHHSSKPLSIDTSLWPSGMYLFRLSTKEGISASKKWILSR